MTPLTLQERFRLIPPCLRDPIHVTNIGTCLGEALNYWIFLLFFITALVSFLMILVAAYQMVSAFGNEAQFTKGKKTLQYAIIGFVIAVLAQFIISLYDNVLRNGLN